MTPPIVKRYLIALDKHKLVPLAGLALGVGAAGVFALQPAPKAVYRAVGVLSYNRPATSFSTTGTQIQEQGKELNEAILRSENVIKGAAARVKSNPKQIERNLRIKMPGEKGPSVIQVFYSDNDPQRAGETLEAVMQGMVEQSRLINTARLRAIIQSISERLPQESQQLREVEGKLEQYVRTEGPAILAAQDGTVLATITGSQQQQRQIKMTLGGVETQMRSLQSKLGLTPDQAYTSSALSADPIIGNLRSQIYQVETQRELLKMDLRPEHPTMIDLARKQKAYEEQLRQRAAEVIGGNGIAKPLTSQIRKDSSLDPARQQIANTLVGLQTQKETLQQQLVATIRAEQEARREYATLPNKQMEQVRLQQQVELQQKLYGQMQAALADAKAAEAETVSSLIPNGATVESDEKQSPKVPLTVAIGGLLGLLAGGGAIFLLASLDAICHTVEEIRAAMRQREVPLLAELPYLMIFDAELDETPVLLNPDSPYLPFYERFRSNLRRVGSNPVKVVAIASTLTSEGKTVSAYNLAIASARAGKRTLIVEADLRSPSAAKVFNVTPYPDANLEPLRYYNFKNECIRLVPDVENLYIVPSPGPVRGAAAILESDEFRRLLEDARSRFDLVILDTPSLSSCNDALVLQPYTDGIVLVTRPGYSQENILAEAIDEWAEAELPLLGAVINGVDKVISIPRPPRTNVVAPQAAEEQEVETPEEMKDKPTSKQKMKR